MTKLRTGGRFLFESANPESIFTYEDFDEESLLFAQTAHDFALQEVLSKRDQLEAQKSKIEQQRSLLKQAGELGLLMVEIPERFGGIGGRLSSALLVAESISKLGSFTASFSCHTGIGTVPILLFGTEQQKETYLPQLATGELIGAYALSEEGYGSDALHAKTKATRDGEHYILNGTKQFITNAGFADLFTVYAQVDGKAFSAFIVEANTPGLSTGPEEHKMGIRGSSTRQVILDNVKIPAANLLGEVGKGHKIALNVLNIGRLKLGLCCLGASRALLQESLSYAANRKQFGVTIDQFQLIQEKLANIALEIYALESMAYRCSGAIDEALAAIDRRPDDPGYIAEKMACIEDRIIEASMLKVFGSEVLDRTVDEAVQIHGGYGYVEEYPICGAYRDARINRIFEGTSEINRMLIPGTYLKRALGGKLDLMTPIMKLMGEIETDSIPQKPEPGLLGQERHAVSLLRRLALFGYGVVSQQAMSDPGYLKTNQILLRQLADLTTDLYAADSALLRTRKMQGKNAIPIQLTEVIVYEKLRQAMELARQICANVAGNDPSLFGRNRKALDRLTRPGYGLDTMSRKTSIAAHLIEREQYAL